MKTKKVSIIIGILAVLAGIAGVSYFFSTPALSNAQENLTAPVAVTQNVISGAQSIQSTLDLPINLEGITAAGSAQSFRLWTGGSG
jgi:hypothetical protein